MEEFNHRKYGFSKSKREGDTCYYWDKQENSYIYVNYYTISKAKKAKNNLEIRIDYTTLTPYVNVSPQKILHLYCKVLHGELLKEFERELPHYDEVRKGGYYDQPKQFCQCTDDYFKAFYEACLAYDLEYAKAMDSLAYPAENELAEAYSVIKCMRRKELANVKKLMNKNADWISRLGKEEAHAVVDCYRDLHYEAETDPRIRAKEALNSQKSILLCRQVQNAAIEPSESYLKIKTFFSE